MEFRQDEIVFLNLVKSGIWGTESSLPEGFDGWNEVVNLAKAQSMGGVASNEILMRYATLPGFEKDLRLKLKSLKVSIIMSASTMKENLVKVFTFLQENGFSPVLLKGTGLAVNYPHPELRQNGDIDIYVGLKDYTRSYELLKPLASSIDPIENIWIDKNYSLTFGKVTVEVHRYLDEYPLRSLNRKFQSIASRHLAAGLDKFDVDGMQVSVPPPTFNAFYVFMHMFRHFMNKGVGLRQVCDWMLLLNRYKDRIDLNELEMSLKEMNLFRPWQDFSAMAVSYLGCSTDILPFYRESVPEMRQRKILKMILAEGNFGKETAYYTERKGSYLSIKMVSLYRQLRRYAQLSFLYPGHAFSYLTTVFKFGFGTVGRDFKKKLHGR